MFGLFPNTQLPRQPPLMLSCLYDLIFLRLPPQSSSHHPRQPQIENPNHNRKRAGNPQPEHKTQLKLETKTLKNIPHSIKTNNQHRVAKIRNQHKEAMNYSDEHHLVELWIILPGDWSRQARNRHQKAPKWDKGNQKGVGRIPRMSVFDYDEAQSYPVVAHHEEVEGRQPDAESDFLGLGFSVLYDSFLLLFEPVGWSYALHAGVRLFALEEAFSGGVDE